MTRTGAAWLAVLLTFALLAASAVAVRPAWAAPDQASECGSTMGCAAGSCASNCDGQDSGMGASARLEIESGENASFATTIAFILAFAVTVGGIAKVLLRRYGGSLKS